jgi:hypothetical protein
VRVQLAQAAGLNNEGILKELKRIILSAVNIRVYKSRDINIIISDETIKKRAQRLPLIEKLKILKRDYLIKVSRITLNIKIIINKNTNNNLLV